jgi:hypothetical protein
MTDCFGLVASRRDYSPRPVNESSRLIALARSFGFKRSRIQACGSSFAAINRGRDLNRPRKTTGAAVGKFIQPGINWLLNDRW